MPEQYWHLLPAKVILRKTSSVRCLGVHTNLQHALSAKHVSWSLISIYQTRERYLVRPAMTPSFLKVKSRIYRFRLISFIFLHRVSADLLWYIYRQASDVGSLFNTLSIVFYVIIMSNDEKQSWSIKYKDTCSKMNRTLGALHKLDLEMQSRGRLVNNSFFLNKLLPYIVTNTIKSKQHFVCYGR